MLHTHNLSFVYLKYSKWLYQRFVALWKLLGVTRVGWVNLMLLGILWLYNFIDNIVHVVFKIFNKNGNTIFFIEMMSDLCNFLFAISWRWIWPHNFLFVLFLKASHLGQTSMIVGQLFINILVSLKHFFHLCQETMDFYQKCWIIFEINIVHCLYNIMVCYLAGLGQIGFWRLHSTLEIIK